jgi:hypothetical protein
LNAVRRRIDLQALTTAPREILGVLKGSVMSQARPDDTEIDVPAGERKLPPEAQRALAEAEARRREAARGPMQPLPQEFNGPAGPEPIRYGDWERKGIASDF